MKRAVPPIRSEPRKDQPVRLPFVGDDQSLVVRTWFGDPTQWDDAKRTLARSLAEELTGSELEDTLTIADDEIHEGWSPQQFVELCLKGEAPRDYLFIADERAQTAGDTLLLVVNLKLMDPHYDDEPPSTGRTFRVPSQQVFSVHANLSLKNMPFDELADFIEARGRQIDTRNTTRPAD